MAGADPRNWMWAEACAMIERAEQMHRQFFQPGSAAAPAASWEPPIDVFESERDLLIVSGEKDPNCPIGGAEIALASAREAFRAAGREDHLKIDVAEGVALAIGHTATRRGNRLGLVAFGPGDPRWRRPRQGRRALLLTLDDEVEVTFDFGLERPSIISLALLAFDEQR